MVQQVLHGVDINRHAVQLAACNLTLSSPRVDYHRMPLYTAKHGIVQDENGERAVDRVDRTPAPRPESRTNPAGARAARVTEEQVPTGRTSDESMQFAQEIAEPFDLVIMNPPFTRNDIRNRQLDRDARTKARAGARD